MKLLTALILACFAVLPATAQQVQFLRENVTITLDTGHVTFVAEQTFRNNSSHSVEQTMFCPLQVRKEGLKRDSVSVQDLRTGTFVHSCRKMAAGLFYMLDFQPSELKKIRLYCRDDHDNHMITYLIKTQADYWMGSIESAIYTLRYNDSQFTVDSTSYKPDDTSTGEDGTILTWKRLNFHPDREMVIYFHKK